VTGLDDALRTAIRSWRGQDPDADTRSALDDLVEHADRGDQDAAAELADAFAQRLEFGTAGLRGALGPGPNRMNRVVVGQAAAGLAAYLIDRGHAGGAVIVGFDARHKSDVFAADTAQILAAAGLQPLITPGPTPTPLVCFGIKHFGCVAGVVVTASHNPPEDNGYKVYLGDGSQIVPPADADIAEHIASIASRPLTQVPRSQEFRRIGDELTDAYLTRAGQLVAGRTRNGRWVYTPMHGVGKAVVLDAVARAGFSAPQIVAEQAEPDPGFPTLPFPNPEEPGAMNRAIALTTAQDADLVIANDPDADRCAVAVPDESPDGPRWQMLSGDELGVLLADDALRQGVQGTYACSIVSSSLLAALARDYGQPFRYTLTGFKWIGRVPGLAFGYEEALGYCCDPAAVSDKDGITALLRVLALAADLDRRGMTIGDRLTEIADHYGVYATDQMSFRVAEMTAITDAMSRLRSDPPDELAGQPVSLSDLSDGLGLGDAGVLPPTDAVLITGESIKVVARPSGTEPKLKCYLEAHVPTDDCAVAEARSEADRILGKLRSEMSTVLRTK
jgi:phosphomannomutase